MNLFALTHSSKDNIFRFPLSQPLQTQLRAEFDKQEAVFFQNIEEEVSFNGYYHPESDEILVIDNFSDPYNLAAAIADPMSVPRYDAKNTDLSNIKAIFCGSDKHPGRILIQRFQQSNVISVNKFAIFFSGDSFVKFSDDGISIDQKICSVIEADGVLKFPSFHFVRQIFEMTSYFNEATDDDILEFSKCSALSISDSKKFMGNANQFIRKKIISILKSNLLDNIDCNSLKIQAQRFKVSIDLSSDGKIVIPENKKDLRNLLKFLDEDFFESTIKKTPYVSSSKRAVQ